MRIVSLRRVSGPGVVRAEADVVWEGPRRGPTLLAFETDEAFADDFAAAPEAFALAMMPVAAGLGEPRLEVEGRLCTRLAAGLASSMTLFASWYPWCRRVPVTATHGLHALFPATARRTVTFLSGGVDSLSLLRRNRADFPREHPLSVRDAIFFFGWNSFDAPGGAENPTRRRAHDAQRARLAALGAAEGFTLIPVRSNVRTFHPSFPFTRDVGFGAGMVATAHLFARRVTDVEFASNGHGPVPIPHASHPSLDPNHGSGAVEVRFSNPMAGRMEKVLDLVGWRAGLEALQVCLAFEDPEEGAPNCGRCEKCRRTMLALYAVGALEQATTFPRHETPEGMAAAYRPSGAQQRVYALEVAGALDAAGRHDLAAMLRERVARAARREQVRRLRRRLLAWLPGRRRR